VPTSIHMGFEVGKINAGTIFLRAVRVFFCQYYLTIATYLLIPYLRNGQRTR
jgi:hypothetical protein